MQRSRFEWCCNKKEIFSDWKIPCDGCDRSCEHLTKVSPYRGILGKNRDKIFARDKVCLKCGSKKKLTIDHIVPIAKGGTNDFDNLQTLCDECNVLKGVDIVDYRLGSQSYGVIKTEEKKTNEKKPKTVKKKKPKREIINVDIYNDDLFFVNKRGEEVYLTEQEIKVLLKKGVEFLSIKKAKRKKSDLKCSYCEKYTGNDLDFEYEHLIPKSLGGKKTLLVCHDCNFVKKDLNPFDFIEDLKNNLEFNKKETIFYKKKEFTRLRVENIIKNIQYFLSQEEFSEDIETMRITTHLINR